MTDPDGPRKQPLVDEPRLVSFPPLVQAATRTLILGSMPGKVSLAENQYYAHPRNGFWHIMGNLFGAELGLPYPDRVAILLNVGIGLWDVIGSCTRATSLDSDIDEQSILVNDFSSLFKQYPLIRYIIFNGQKAEQSFRRYVRPQIAEYLPRLICQRLVSTSPANARYSIAEKTRIWSAALTRAANPHSCSPGPRG